jgi:hypothetical protein
MAFRRFVWALVLGLAVGVATPDVAFGGKKGDDKGASKGDDAAASKWKNVETVGLKSIDDVFAPVKQMHGTLSSAEGSMASANTNLATALSLPQGTPFADALAELQKRADGKVTVAMQGTVPKLAASDAVPSDVQAAIDATNGLTTSIASSVQAISQIPAQVQAVIPQISKLPQTFPAEAKTLGAKVTEIPKMLTTLKNNVEATIQTPERAAELVKQIEGTLSLVTTTFGGGKAVPSKSTATKTTTPAKSGAPSTDTPGARKVRPPTP